MLHHYISQLPQIVTGKHYKEMDGGHFIPKGKSSYWALNMENIHAQCKGCNGFGMRYGNAEKQYTIYMIDRYGRPKVDYMINTTKKAHKMYRADYEDLLKDLNEQIRFHLERIGEK